MRFWAACFFRGPFLLRFVVHQDGRVQPQLIFSRAAACSCVSARSPVEPRAAIPPGLGLTPDDPLSRQEYRFPGNAAAFFFAQLPGQFRSGMRCVPSVRQSNRFPFTRSGQQNMKRVCSS
ncbi:MAG: hypothetical protein DMG47_00455 [Acidobacteria bacterium]|nr:MAG: hypothetical protein DMG47_00455 [Acidobacteriota bacterium]